MGKPVAELTIQLLNAVNDSLRILKEIKLFNCVENESPSVYEFAEANLVSALGYLVQPFASPVEGNSRTAWHYADNNGNPVTADEYAASVANATP